MAKIQTKIVVSRDVAKDISGVLDAIEQGDGKEGFSRAELARARKKLGELVKELKPYAAKITPHSIWTIRQTLQEANQWLSENPDKIIGSCWETQCGKTCLVQKNVVSIEVTTTDDRKEIVFGDQHYRHMLIRDCLDNGIDILPSAQEFKPETPLAKSAKPAVETDPKQQLVKDLLAKGLTALGDGDKKRAKEFFVEAQKMDPDNTLIPRFIKKSD